MRVRHGGRAVLWRRAGLLRAGRGSGAARVGSVCTHCFTLTPAEGISAAGPFDLDDLRARLEALVRRSEGQGDQLSI